MSTKILFINQFFYKKDGTATQANEMLRELRNVGAEVIVFPPVSDQKRIQVIKAAKRTKRFIPEQIRKPWRSLHNLLLKKSKGKPQKNPQQDLQQTVRKLEKVVNATKPDVILGRLDILNLALLSQIANWDIPLLLLTDAVLFHEINKVGYGNFSEKEREVERNLWEKADAIIVLSSGLANMIKAQGIDEKKIFINPLGVDPKQFRPGIDGTSVRQRYGLLGETVVGYVGKLNRIHDLNTLIDAFAICLPKCQGGLKLLMVGDGLERPRLEALVAAKALQDHVIFTGYVNYADIPAHIAAMDVVTSPLDKENVIYSSPIKMFEYMAMAKPIVMTKGGQVSEILTDGDTALLVEPHSPEAMSQAILQLVDNPQQRLEIGQRAREIIGQRYTWEANAQKVVQISQQLVKK
ncbi:MAG: glycosyltransferase family 4 protein [Anaerolineales bacterium]|nr:glycosyltransferase family 4 protein [Anaerolineales bacterium]